MIAEGKLYAEVAVQLLIHFYSALSPIVRFSIQNVYILVSIVCVSFVFISAVVFPSPAT